MTNRNEIKQTNIIIITYQTNKRDQTNTVITCQTNKRNQTNEHRNYLLNESNNVITYQTNKRNQTNEYHHNSAKTNKVNR
ncbi:hypothetical protein Hanom_Chr14g01250571 [Helianthus anomalus]